MTIELIILGASGGCLDIIELVGDINSNNKKNKYKILGLLDDNHRNLEKKISNIELLGSFSSVKDFKREVKIVNALGSEKNFFDKEKLLLEDLKLLPQRFETLIHPTCVISSTSKIGIGSIIYQNVTVGRNCQIGINNVILPNCFIGHDSSVGDFVTINAGALISGNVKIGNKCYIGSGAKIKPFIHINNDTLIGIGSTITKDIEKKGIYYGTPAKFIKSL
tara:strand:- start:617 stop:1279 length:663 start_codon:yes stop_codon:yes gene_type:complete